jgi:hypothetical protein
MKHRAPRRSDAVAESTIPALPQSPRGELYARSARVAGKYAVSNLPQITDLEVEFLQTLIADFGSYTVAKWMQVSENVVLRVAANCGFRCRPDTMGAVRSFFGKCDLESASRGYGPGRDSPKKRGPKPYGKARQ